MSWRKGKKVLASKRERCKYLKKNFWLTLSGKKKKKKKPKTKSVEIELDSLYPYRRSLPAGSLRSLNWWAIAPNTGANIEWNTERGTATPIFCWLSLSLFNVNFCNLKNKRNNEHKENICPSHTFIPPLVLSREVTRDRSGCYLVWFDGVALIYSRLSFGCHIFI